MTAERRQMVVEMMQLDTRTLAGRNAYWELYAKWLEGQPESIADIDE